MSSFRIIFDNAGGTTAQFRDGTEFAHYYAEASQVAEDVLAFLADDTVADFEGHEDDAAELRPTFDEVRNGGYRTFHAGGEEILEEARELVTLAEQSGWGNAVEFAARMRQDETFAAVA